jgi:hypothetical protein
MAAGQPGHFTPRDGYYFQIFSAIISFSMLRHAAFAIFDASFRHITSFFFDTDFHADA